MTILPAFTMLGMRSAGEEHTNGLFVLETLSQQTRLSAYPALMSSLTAWALGIPNIVNAPPPTRHRPAGGWGGVGGHLLVCVPFSDPFCSHKMLFCSHKMAFWGSFCGYNIHFVATRWMTKPQVRALCGYKMVTKPWGSG